MATTVLVQGNAVSSAEEPQGGGQVAASRGRDAGAINVARLAPVCRGKVDGHSVEHHYALEH